MAAAVERLPERTPQPATVPSPADAASGDDAAFLLRVLAHDLRNPLNAITIFWMHASRVGATASSLATMES